MFSVENALDGVVAELGHGGRARAPAPAAREAAGARARDRAPRQFRGGDCEDGASGIRSTTL